MKHRIYYQLAVNEHDRTADINIYGTITSAAEIYEHWGISEGEVSARGLKEAIDALDVDTINVYINSYGGEVAEALAIYSALKRHSAAVNTFCDGFACSAATIVFCAGDRRVMGRIALMMIHNCMSYIGYANSEELRKAAEDNDKINQSSIEAYKLVTAGRLSEDEIVAMMNRETWMTAEECLQYGFATEVADDDDEDDDDDEVVQSAFMSMRSAILGQGMTEDKMQRMVTEAVQAALRPIRESIDRIRLEPAIEQEGDALRIPVPIETVRRALDTMQEPEKPVNKARRFFSLLAERSE